MALEMREIEAFLALAEELHFGRAAARLHRTVSSLSQTVKLLERRVGSPLFERSSRRVALTPLGTRFRDDLEPAYLRIQAALRAAQHAARQSTDRTRLNIAATQTVPPHLFEGITDAFQRVWPAVELVWSTMSFDQYYAWFGDSQLPNGADILFCWVPSDSPEVLPRERIMVGPVIAKSGRVLLMSRAHPLAGRTTVDIEELADHGVVYPAAVHNTPFLDAWCPPTTPRGRTIPRHRVDYVFPEQLGSVLDDRLVHITAADTYWRVVGYAGLTSVPLTGLPPFLLVTVWPATADSDLIHSFAASTVRAR
ncbi:MAG TPA: LysR family transcriptional regulator [Nonomuraea sp.]|nr:LysR family transcriptional regulator [Nonomuraea sp.]